MQPESDETFDIYFLVEGDEDFLFYRVPDDQPPPSESGAAFLVPVSDVDDDSDQDFLQPVLKKERGGLRSAGCAAVGTTIYLFGGRCERPYARFEMKKELYYFDVIHPEKGWKQGTSMENPRSNPIGFSVNNKMYAVGGFNNEIGDPPPVEVYNPEDDSWETKCDLPYESIDDSSVYNNGKQVLLFTRQQELIIYSVEYGKWGFCPKPNYDGTYPHTMTVLGETLFMASIGDYGEYEIFGYDFLNNNAKKGGCCGVKVTGLEDLMEYRSDYLLPRRGYRVGVLSGIKLLTIGRNKLAIVWEIEKFGQYCYVNCLKMEICREEYPANPHQMKLTAHSGSFSSHIVKGYRIECYFLVKRDEQRPEDQSNHGCSNEDERKDHEEHDEHIK